MEINKRDTEKTYKWYEFNTDHFEIRWPTNQATKFAERLKKLIDKRGDWPSMLYQEIMKKMKYIKVKDAAVTLEKLQYEETVTGFADEFLKKLEVDTTPKQSTIEEAVEGVKPKPAKIK